MRVLVIPSWYPNGEDKLMGIYHKEFTEALNIYGIEANMLFIERERISKPLNYLFMKKKEIINERNYKVYIHKLLNLEPINFNLGMKLYTKKLEKAFKEYLKNNKKPNVIHAQVAIPAGYAACALGKKYNIPVIVTEHYSQFENFYKDNKYKKYSEYVFKNSTYSTVSKYMRDVVLKYTNECHIIPNLVDTKTFNNNIKRKKNKTFNLVCICALRIGKNVDIAIKSIRKLKDKNYDIHLDIIGDGFNKDYYEQLSKELDLNKQITFHGRKTKKEIAEILKKEHALLITSRLETFGIPGIEAMASGIPIISTNCCGPTEYINNKVGVICNIEDVDDMTNKIQYVINNYDKYDSDYIKKFANKYSKEEVIKKTIKLYKKINNE